MMSAAQASEVIKNENLESMRFALTALRPFIREMEMIYSYLCLGNFPEGLRSTIESFASVMGTIIIRVRCRVCG